MKILLISPLAYPASADMKYGGVERLVWQYANELSKEHEVSTWCLEGSQFSGETYTVPNVEPLMNEVKAYQSYSYKLREYDVIHDFSMLHIAARSGKFKACSIFWHDPRVQYKKAPYNVIALSRWASWEFRKYYNQEARYQQSIVIDTEVYKPSGERGERYLTLGKMSPEKGNLNAVIFAKNEGLKLDIVGGRGSEVSPDAPLSDYEKEILSYCNDDIKFLGEVGEAEKIKLLQSAKGLLYITDHAEVTSHKIMEATACGCPVLAPNIGAMSEVVDSSTGVLFESIDELPHAVKKLDNIKDCAEFAKQWDIKKVIEDYIPLYEEVAQGKRW